MWNSPSLWFQGPLNDKWSNVICYRYISLYFFVKHCVGVYVWAHMRAQWGTGHVGVHPYHWNISSGLLLLSPPLCVVEASFELEIFLFFLSPAIRAQDTAKILGWSSLSALAFQVPGTTGAHHQVLPVHLHLWEKTLVILILNLVFSSFPPRDNFLNCVCASMCHCLQRTCPNQFSPPTLWQSQSPQIWTLWPFPSLFPSRTKGPSTCTAFFMSGLSGSSDIQEHSGNTYFIPLPHSRDWTQFFIGLDNKYS